MDLSWGLPVDEGGSLVGTWDLYYDWYCSGVPGGPGSAEFYEDGTGIVHIAPSFGSDDNRLAKQNNIGSLTLVDKQGRFTKDLTDFSGMYVKKE